MMLVASVCVFVPFAPSMPMRGLDGSWMLAINQAVAEHLPFGRSLIFTAGPYSAIYTTAFHPATDTMMLAGSTYLAITYSACLVAIARRGRWAFPPAFLLVFCCIRFPRDTLLFTLPLLVVVVCLDVARHTNERRAERIIDALLLTSAFAALGLLPLIKGTLLVCVALVPLCVAFLIIQQRIRPAIIALCSFIGGAVVFWTSAGQALTDLPSYFAWTIPIVSGYAEAMSLPGEPDDIVAYAGAATLLTFAATQLSTLSRLQRAYFGAAILGLLFVVFKSGFVRHDGHAVIASSFLLFAAIALLAVERSGWTLVATVAAVGAWQHVDERFYGTRGQDLSTRAGHVFVDAWNGIVRRRVDPEGLAYEYRATLSDVAARHPIVRLTGTVDIYPYDLTELIASGNRWSPRPVFQSYSAYTPSLATVNRDSLAGAQAPEHVVFGIQPFDGHVPALDDGASWPVLLGRYRPTMVNNGRLYLDRQPGAAPAALSSSRSAEAHRLGEIVPVPPTARPLFAEFEFRPTFLGRLFALAFKPGQLWITLRLTDGSARAFRIVSGAAKAGFVMSPVVEDVTDFAMLYGPQAVLSGKRVASLSVDRRTGSPLLWQRTYEVRFREISGIPRVDLAPLVTTDAFVDPLATVLAAEAVLCDGSIDHANGAPLQNSLIASNFLRVDGWLAASTQAGRLAQQTFITLTDETGRTRFVDTHPTDRADVAAYFGRPILGRSGFATLVNLTGLSGRYRLSLAYKTDSGLHQCNQVDVPLVVRND